MLPLYDDIEDKNHAVIKAGESADEEEIVRGVFADVPVSRRQCGEGWIEICGFVLGGGGRRPSAGMKLGVWRRVLEGAVLQGIDLGTQFLVRDLWKSVLDEGGEEEPFPRGLFEAVVRRVCDGSDGFGGLKCEYLSTFWGNRGREDIEMLIYVSMDLGASIDRTKCTQWVGETYLEAMAPTSASAIGRSEFLNAWRDLLPESWRDDVAFSKLTVR
jgi:sister chromatid cohesion protein DCC1